MRGRLISESVVYEVLGVALPSVLVSFGGDVCLRGGEEGWVSSILLETCVVSRCHERR